MSNCHGQRGLLEPFSQPYNSCYLHDRWHRHGNFQQHNQRTDSRADIPCQGLCDQFGRHCIWDRPEFQHDFQSSVSADFGYYSCIQRIRGQRRQRDAGWRFCCNSQRGLLEYHSQSGYLRYLHNRRYWQRPVFQFHHRADCKHSLSCQGLCNQLKQFNILRQRSDIQDIDDCNTPYRAYIHAGQLYYGNDSDRRRQRNLEWRSNGQRQRGLLEYFRQSCFWS
jgi:hypothetical protein